MGGLAISFELFKKSKRQNSQGYSYSISVSNLENKGNVHETVCDSQICHLPPSLFTHTPISIHPRTSLRLPIHPSEKAMAPHSSTLAWKIPRMEEPGRLQSIGSQRVGHDRATSLSIFTFMHWRRKWHPTPVFLPGESQGRGSLMGCRLRGRTESDTTEAT